MSDDNNAFENNTFENNEQQVNNTPENNYSYNNSYNSYNSQNTGGGSGKGQSTGLGIASMVLGILSILLICCVYGGSLAIIAYCAPVCGILAIVLGIVQIVKNESKGMAIAGIVCGAVGVVLFVGLFALGMYILSSGLYEELLSQYGNIY